MNELFNIGWFILPILGAFFLLIIILSIRKSTTSKFKTTITFLKIITIENIPIPAKLIFYFLLGIEVFLLGYPFFRDYSPMIPSRYELVAKFDTDGIKNILNTYSNDQKKNLKIMPKWEHHKELYLKKEFNSLIKKNTGKDFDLNKVTSTGENRCSWKKVKGFQKYAVYKAKGSLNHKYGSPPFTIDTSFSLSNLTPIQASLSDIFVHWAFVVKLKFTQEVTIKLGEKLDLCEVLTVTKIRLPTFDVQETLYLIEKPNGGRFPIGYAINTATD